MIDLNEIRRRREELKLTYDEAAQRAGFEQRQRWYVIETGRRTNITPDTLFALAKALGCDMEDLMTQRRPKVRGRRKDQT